MATDYSDAGVNDFIGTGCENPHTFHIPVMGTGFTVDTPLRVARYGISSVVSIGDDVLLEQMRRVHCRKQSLPYEEISVHEDDYRARRITAYLDLLNVLVAAQLRTLEKASFEPDSDLSIYFELLPEGALKQVYMAMRKATDPDKKIMMQTALRRSLVAGSIDVNIMTKVDGDRYRDGKKLPVEEAVAMSALRGYANSTLASSIVLSAGMNRRLFGYMASFDDFFPDGRGILKKKIVLKVSDFRSALLQGRLLVRKGLWVSEFRVESGLNCGGHAFATKGTLVGPILEEFSRNRRELMREFNSVYQEALAEQGRPVSVQPHPIRLTMQGGIVTAEENDFLLKHYQIDGTGWGTPFLLVPEVTNVDEAHLKKLVAATRNDVHLSESSPLGVPFWNLRTSASEAVREGRIESGHPGSPCPKGYLSADTEFTPTPICPASRAYQEKKLIQLAESDGSSIQKMRAQTSVLAKVCLCADLAAGALIKNEVTTSANAAICCGPSISYFNRIVTLKEMVDHIYGRLSIIDSAEKTHMFIAELELYLEYLRAELRNNADGVIERTAKYFTEFRENLGDGIKYYQNLAQQLRQDTRERFLEQLDELSRELDGLFVPEILTIETNS